MRKLVFYKILLIITILAFSCQTKYKITKLDTQNLTLSSEIVGTDSLFTALIKPYKDKIDKDMSKVIGISDYEMEKDKPESLLTNFMADLLLEEGSQFCEKSGLEFVPDMAFVNYGGIRTSLPKGEITVGKIFELMPFENEMVFVKLNGTSMHEFINQLAARGEDGVAGIQFGILDEKASNILISNKKINMEQSYWLVTNDYIAGGGDNMDILKDNRLDFKESGLLLREIIIGNLDVKYQKGETITSKLDGRIYNE